MRDIEVQKPNLKNNGEYTSFHLYILRKITVQIFKKHTALRQ